jgi:hypothetical protein
MPEWFADGLDVIQVDINGDGNHTASRFSTSLPRTGCPTRFYVSPD